MTVSGAIRLSIRASSFPKLLDCPARWHAIHVEGKEGPTSGPAHLGTSLHSGAAKFDQSVLEKEPISPDDAVDHVLEMIKHPAHEVNWGDLSQLKAREVAHPLILDYCERIAPTLTFEKVEVKCTPLVIDMGDNVSFELTGTADRVRVEYDQSRGLVETREGAKLRGISDLKSGRQIIRNGQIAIEKHIGQLAAYEIMEIMVERELQQEMVLPAQVIALPTSGSERRVQVDEVERPSRVLLGEGSHAGVLRVAAGMARSGVFHGNPSSQLCSKKYCPIYPCWWTGRK